MDLPESFDTALSKAVKVVLQYDSADAGGGRKWLTIEGDHCDMDEYLQAIDEIVKSIKSAQISPEDRTKLESTVHIAKNQLKNEFQTILNSSCLTTFTEISPAYSSSFSTGGYSFAGSIVGCVHDLRSIAERMSLMGYPHDCKSLYRTARKSHLDANFRRIGIEKLSISDIRRMQWEELEEKIGQWIRAAQFCIENLFCRENIMCQEVFEDLQTAKDDAFFMEIVKDHVTMFFAFSQAVSSIRPSAERLFKILDLHERLSSLLPDIEYIFSAKSSEWVQIQAKITVSQLGQAARDILHNFEHSVLAHSWSVTGVEEGVHPLTTYVMEYLTKTIYGYGQPLTTLITSKPEIMIERMGDTVLNRRFIDRENQSPLASHLVWIITSLHCNLKIKSKQHKDYGYEHLFLMNNEENIRIARESYMLSTWNKMQQDFSNGMLIKKMGFGLKLIRFCAGGQCSSRKHILKDINSTFEEIHRTQSRWLVPDLQLRQELHQCILNGLVPLYDSFVKQLSEKGKKLSIKYSVDDLHMAISQMFEGVSGAAPIFPSLPLMALISCSGQRGGWNVQQQIHMIIRRRYVPCFMRFGWHATKQYGRVLCQLQLSYANTYGDLSFEAAANGPLVCPHDPMLAEAMACVATILNTRGCNGKSSNSSSSILHRESILQRKDNVPRSIQRPANHVRYIVLQVQECELIKVSIWDLEENIRIARELYMLSTWNKMHQDLSNGLLLKKMGFGLKFIGYCDGGQCPSRKHILKDMNCTFEEIHRTQSRWLIPDLQLRQELHQCILNRLVRF
nr:exocyst complex component EXO70A1-like [Ipomoea batatas]